MTVAPATDLFLALTPERVLDAVEAVGLACNPVCYPMNSFENRVYEVELVDRTRLVAKFYRPGRWSGEQILEEHQFLADLAQDEIPVCPVRAFPDGSTLRQIDSIYYCLFERRGGRAPDELDDALVARLGMLAARLHNVGARRPARHRIALSTDTYVYQDLAWLDKHDVLPRHLRKRYFAVATALAEITDRLMDGVAVQRIHGDLHHGNLLLRDGLLHLLDFDDMVVGPPVQDVWLILPGRDAYTLRQREILLEAYEQLRAFDRRSLRLIEPLRGLRLVHYAAWLARRYHDPAFQIAWPEFGTETYWLREVEDLELLLRVIRGEEIAAQGPESDAPQEEEEETLSNKDLFWDWEDR